MLVTQFLAAVMSKQSIYLCFFSMLKLKILYAFCTIYRCESNDDCISLHLCKDFKCQPACTGVDCRVSKHRPLCEYPKVENLTKKYNINGKEAFNNSTLCSFQFDLELSRRSICWMSATSFTISIFIFRGFMRRNNLWNCKYFDVIFIVQQSIERLF